jgi:ABC-type glycerol-3-phosphate transport system permease component
LNALLVFDLSNLPPTITTLLNQIKEYIIAGISVIQSFMGSTAMGVIALHLAIIIAMNAAYFLYSFVFWVIRKIPMLGVKE